MSADDSVLAYQHSLPPVHYEQLCALPEVIARYAPGANRTEILANIRRDCTELPPDPDREGNRLLELDTESQEAVLAMLRWAGNRSEDARFIWLARDIEAGARESDRMMADQSLLN